MGRRTITLATGRLQRLALGSILLVNCSSDHTNQIPASDACAGCGALQYVNTIGSITDPASADTLMPAVARDRRGNWYVVASTRSEVMVYSPSGQYLRSIGQAGDGPGELRLARYITTADDSLLVFSSGRYTTYDSTGVVLRTTPMPLIATKAYFGEDFLVVQASLPTREGSGHPLHKVANGDVIASFGADGDQVLNSTEPDPVTAAAGGGRYWIVRDGHYRLELWSPDTGLIKVMDQPRPWFDAPKNKIKAYLADVWMEPGDSLVWTSVVHVHRATRARPLFVSVVEAIDIHTEKAVVRDSVLGHRLTFMNDGHLFSTHPTETGNIVVSLWRRPTTLQ